MGCFASTCCISGLPIDAGDEVRYLLLTENPYWEGGFVCESHGRWVPRTWPIKARYNDYGSIEDWETGAVVDSYMQGFQHDLVEVGVGDNTCHDVATSKDMSFDQLLNAVWEGRVRVNREFNRRGPRNTPEPQPYVPTRQHVIDALAGIDLPEHNEFLVDEQDNWTRVRWHGAGPEFGRDQFYLDLAQQALTEFATVITAAKTGACILRVFVPPGIAPGGYSRTAHWKNVDRKNSPLLIQQAMIREDVWQKILSLPNKTWSGTRTVDHYRTNARKHLGEYKGDERRYMSDRGLGTGFLSQEIIPFSCGLAEHAQLILGNDDIPADFADTVADFTFLFHFLTGVRYVWRSSDTAGSQCGEWKPQQTYLQALADLAALTVKTQAEDPERWDYDDEDEE